MYCSTRGKMAAALKPPHPQLLLALPPLRMTLGNRTNSKTWTVWTPTNNQASYDPVRRDTPPPAKTLHQDVHTVVLSENPADDGSVTFPSSFQSDWRRILPAPLVVRCSMSSFNPWLWRFFFFFFPPLCLLWTDKRSTSSLHKSIFNIKKRPISCCRRHRVLCDANDTRLLQTLN